MTSAYKQHKTNSRLAFTTLDGKSIPFVPFSWDEWTLSKEGLKEEYRERGEIIDCPQYKVTYAGGTSEMFDHNPTTIEQAPPETPPEDIERIIAEQKETWQKYQAISATFEAQVNEELAEKIISECLAGITLPTDNSWEETQHKNHIKNIPADPEEKRRHYIWTVLVKFKSDQMELMSTITAVSMGVVQEEALDTIKASFRDSIWRDGLKELSRRDATAKVENAPLRQLDVQPEADLDPGAQAVALDQS
jgi:hypothetical protein